MTSTTRTRFGEFGSGSKPNGEQSRAIHGSAFGQSFGNGSTGWGNGGIWSNGAIGSGIKSGANETSRIQDVDAGIPDGSEAITGSRSLLPSSESDTTNRPRNSPWSAVDTTSPGMSSVHSHSSTSPVRARGSSSHATQPSFPEKTRSSSPYFSVAHTGALGQAVSSNQNFLDPSSGSFKSSATFDADQFGRASRHNSNEESRQITTPMVFGTADVGFSTPGGLSNSNKPTSYSGYTSSAVSRSGSIPPSRNDTDHITQFGKNSSVNTQHSQLTMPRRPNHSANPSTYSSQTGLHRYTDQQNFPQFGDLAINLGKMSLGKENHEPFDTAQQDAYYEFNSQMPPNAIWGPGESGLRDRQDSFAVDDTRLDSLDPSAHHHRSIQFGTQSSHSPGSFDTRHSHSSPMYSNGGTPPLNEHHRTPSSRTTRSYGSTSQEILLERKLRRLQQEQQQAFLSPQLNSLQFRPPYASPYDYNPQNILRMNPLANYYAPMSMPAIAPVQPGRIVPRGPMIENTGESLRSTLLEEFRSNNKGNKRYELKDIYNHVVEFSGDQHGSRFIQQKLETANSDEKDQVFKEILPNSLQLTTDVFGNYVIQKFFEHGNQQQKKILANQMKGHVLELSLQMYGCRVVQKAFEHILTDQQATLVKELEHQVLKCVKDQNGNHVVQKAIERIPAEHIQFIINAFTGQAHSLATDSYGCRVIQRMLEHCKEPSRTQLLQELHACASSLIVDQYGNYVMQHVIERDREQDRTRIISLVMAQLVVYSKHKFASNVVEKSIQFGTNEQRQEIVKLLTALNERGESPLQALMRDQYGNYVIQKLLIQLEGSEYDSFVEHIKPQLQLLKRFSYGKQIAAIEKVMYNAPSAASQFHSTQSSGHVDTSVVPTPPLLTEDTQSPQSSSLPSTNTSTVDGPIGDRKPSGGNTIELAASTSI